MAEGEGFEPPEPCGSTVFKTAAIGHSAILPSFMWVQYKGILLGLSTKKYNNFIFIDNSYRATH